jgi:Asp-tRNA(Asn)/Glu-tRNA(Gln) amidotransferase A subunit family amidase
MTEAGMPAGDATHDDLSRRSATELADAIRARTLSPVEVVDAVVARIDAANPHLNAYCTVTADSARRDARRAADAVARGEEIGPLHGIPYSLKDLTDTAGVRTTMGSRLFADRVPAADSVLAERLAAAGGILVGKTNTPDHGCKGVTDNGLFGTTVNPWDAGRTPGGSSGGAAAAVAAGMAPLAEGSDFAGSIRIPASFCGVVGLKPSTGRIPLYPNPAAWHPVSFVSGPLTRTVADAALMLQVMAGPDSRDPISLPDPGVDYTAATAESATPHGARIAWTPDLGIAPVDDEIVRICEQALREVAGVFGFAVDSRSPALPDCVDAYGLLNDTLRSGLMAPYFDTRRSDIDPLLVRKVQQARGRTAEDVGVAQMTQTAVYHEIRQLLETYDYIVLPTTPTAAFDLSQQYQSQIAGRPIGSPYQTLPLTFVFNLTGHPAISIPAGWTAAGLPVGIQIVGRWRDDFSVLALAAAFERAHPWRDRWPDLTASSPQEQPVIEGIIR